MKVNLTYLIRLFLFACWHPMLFRRDQNGMGRRTNT